MTVDQSKLASSPMPASSQETSTGVNTPSALAQSEATPTPPALLEYPFEDSAPPRTAPLKSLPSERLKKGRFSHLPFLFLAICFAKPSLRASI